jgi:hypothetical protein
MSTFRYRRTPNPEALGCRPAARGVPYCVAFVAHPALGFAWGFARELGEIRSHGPQPLSGRDWDVHKGLLEHEHPDWSFERRSNREGVAGGPRKAADA